LGILAAIAIPRLGGFRDNAQETAEVATARTIASAISLAEADNGGAAVADGDTGLALVQNHLSGTTIGSEANSATGVWGVVITNATDGVTYTITAPDGTVYTQNDMSGS
jgi:type II secretory pathway pseudopilin PulG